jgi:iron complex outermembrane receptor protein
LNVELDIDDIDDFVTISVSNNNAVCGGSPDFSEGLFNIGLVDQLNDKTSVCGSFTEGFTISDVA